jgi:hypothetical protein
MPDVVLENPITRLSKDLKIAARTLSNVEARYLVDSYYQLQKIRIAQGNQAFSMEKEDQKKEPHAVLDWFIMNAESLENQVKRALDAYSDEHLEGRWAKSQIGIGPVITSGLLAHIDYDKKDELTNLPLLKYAGQIWSFAGIAGNHQVWEKGQKRPWNASLKTLCWKIGQSFLKQSTNEEAFYGILLRRYWEGLKERNERLEFKAAAEEKLAKFKIDKKTDAYKAYIVGKLPPAHVLQRACRYATKIFLSHYHCVAYEVHRSEKAELPYIIAHGGHKDYIAPPNWPMEES